MRSQKAHGRGLNFLLELLLLFDQNMHTFMDWNSGQVTGYFQYLSLQCPKFMINNTHEIQCKATHENAVRASQEVNVRILL